MEYVEVLKSVLKERNVDLDMISLDSDLNELGLDSLDTASALIDIEEQLGIEFTSEEFAVTKTLRDVIKLIEEKINSK